MGEGGVGGRSGSSGSDSVPRMKPPSSSSPRGEPSIWHV